MPPSSLEWVLADETGSPVVEQQVRKAIKALDADCAVEASLPEMG